MRRIDGHPLWIGTARDARAIKEVLGAGIEAVVVPVSGRHVTHAL